MRRSRGTIRVGSDAEPSCRIGVTETCLRSRGMRTCMRRSGYILFLMVSRDRGWDRPARFGRGISRIQFCLSFLNRQPRVILRIVLVVGAVVGNALDDGFGVVAAVEGPFCEGPIIFGLALVVGGHGSLTFLTLDSVS